MVAAAKVTLNADTGLKNFLTISKKTLRTSNGQYTGTTVNICNTTRNVDVTIAYLAKAFGLNVANLATNYVFDTNISLHSFPVGSQSPSQTYIPTGAILYSYPGLDRMFWTIMDQYTSTTEPTMRQNKDKVWCHYKGLGMYEHCKDTRNTIGSGCGGGNTYSRANNCKVMWRYFMDACHRIRSLNPNVSPYYHSYNPEGKCISTDASNTIYYLYRNWGRSCSDMETKIHSLANNTLATGWLELENAAAGFSKNYKIPGTKMNYKCSKGFSQPDGTNPNQKLTCSGSLKVDMTQIRLCERKHTLLDIFFCFTLPFFQPTDARLVGRTWQTPLGPPTIGRVPSSTRPL
jgi:hypothetical protein